MVFELKFRKDTTKKLYSYQQIQQTQKLLYILGKECAIISRVQKFHSNEF